VFGSSGDHDATVGVNAVVSHDGQTLADLVTDLQTRRAVLATILVAQGVPMLSSGDELGRSQGGERDGYRLEPERWGLDWSSRDAAAGNDLVAWLGAAVQAWHEHPALRRSAWVAPGQEAIRWRDPSGAAMTERSWHDEGLNGLAFERSAPTELDQRVLVLVARVGANSFVLPSGSWRPIIDSRSAEPTIADELLCADVLEVLAPAVVVLVAVDV
jgi:isoamylase